MARAFLDQDLTDDDIDDKIVRVASQGVTTIRRGGRCWNGGKDSMLLVECHL